MKACMMEVKLLRDKIEHIHTLPTIPGVLKRLSGIIDNPGVSLNEISHFVSNDPALASKVLKMVNSAIYGFPGRISSISHAVMLLGLNVVKGLLLGVSVLEVMQQAMLGLREHSIGCAVAAKVIAEKKGIKEPDEISVAGLLHDIGKVILILEFPREYQKALGDAAEKGISIAEAEVLTFPESHARVGSWLAEKWHFPKSLVEIIENHHKPENSRIVPVETAIVHVSDVLIRARGIGFPGDSFVYPVSQSAFEKLALSESDLREILKIIEHSIESTQEIYSEE